MFHQIWILSQDHFNSRPREEVDSPLLPDQPTYWISTHDLAKRSTGTSAGTCTVAVFQLTTSRRGRQQHFELDAWQFVFQLTTSRGGRRKPFLFKQEEKPFQLTTSRGGRLLSCQALRCHWYFNSRPRKEVDEHLKRLNPSWIIFQLTTSQGGRH